jgi:hypothetical protein
MYRFTGGMLCPPTVEPGEITGRIAGLLLGEVDPLDVLGRVRGGAAGAVDDREVDIRVLRRHLLERRGHQEADRDHELVAGLCQPSEVRDIVSARLRLQHGALDSELRLGLEEALIGQMVEAVVVEPADVGDQADLEAAAARRARSGAGAAAARRGGRATARARGTAVATSARGQPQSQRCRGESNEADRPDPSRHQISFPPEPNGQP